MKITHFSNSFITVSSQGECIVCDPWVGKANASGWQSFPEFSALTLREHLADVRWVYLSHLHDDHFHPDTLKSCGLLDREFIIKRFQSPVLRERLKRLGITRIHEVDPFTVQRFGPFELSIFPQMTSNLSGLDDEVNYDLDTSVAFRANGKVFFNQVDNPLSVEDLTQLRDWMVKKFGYIDIACLMSGAASEYPYLFLGIDQASEKRRIVDNALNKLTIWLRLLAPSYYFPAGGTYLTPGWLSTYSENVAQPTFQEISESIKQKLPEVQPLALEGGYSIDMSIGRPEVSAQPELMPIEADLQTAIRSHSGDPYDYEVLVAPSYAGLVEMLETARENWLKKIIGDALHIMQSIRFEIYSELIGKGAKPDSAHLLGNFQLFQTSDKEAGDLIIHIDQRALYGCVSRRFVWNGVLGSLCLYERRPNRHYPTDFFSINFFTLPHGQKV